MELYQQAKEKLDREKVMTPEINDLFVKSLSATTDIITELEKCNPFELIRQKEHVKQIYYTNAEILARTVDFNKPISDPQVLNVAAQRLQKVLSLYPMDTLSQELYKTCVMALAVYDPDTASSLKLLNRITLVTPYDYQLQFNLGFTYSKANNLEDSLRHYKLALGILEKEPDSQTVRQFKVKTLNGIGGIYYAIQDRALAEYYYLLAKDVLPEDPDIHNQLGVVYTELRQTQDAIECYEKAIAFADKAHISTDKNLLLASANMNMGLAYCYEINYPKAIDCYNKALEFKPDLSLAYQNKLLDLNYVSWMISDDMYIANAHKKINLVYPEVVKSRPGWAKPPGAKIHVAFVSGDLVCHPVSYFLKNILKYIDKTRFDVTCYSMKVNNPESFEQVKLKTVKGMSTQQLYDTIVADQVDILFDLSSQTGDNRLDVFAKKPAPVQISYLGYPNTSGLENMDYHIVDHFTDSDGLTPGIDGKVWPSTQRYYSEQLIFMSKCFLSYECPDTSSTISPPNEKVVLGCFNRYNKINALVTKTWQQILDKFDHVSLLVKTKEFCTEKLKLQFISAFTPETRSRVKVIPYSDLYQEHMETYNQVHFALDTFPYSGTTTTCEALYMGVPVITLFDSVRGYHVQNVTSSIMHNCGLDEYIAKDTSGYIDLAGTLTPPDKASVKAKFIKGICDPEPFVREFEEKIASKVKK